MANALQVPCWDCRQAPATRTFLHMTKGHFPLCDSCFEFADHDDDYLETCTCLHPEGAPDATICRACTRVIVRCTCQNPAHFGIWGRRCFTCNGVTDPFFTHRARFALFHEELMQKAWHPIRVARWLEAGEEVLDMMMGL